MADVFLNNKLVGVVDDVQAFYDQFISEKRFGNIDYATSIRLDKSDNSVHIDNGLGRTIRPLIVVKNGQSSLTKNHIDQLKKGEISWSDLIKQGVIEYLDASAEENAYVALSFDDITDEHTHLEIANFAIFGLCTAQVPFASHNHGVRLSQGSKNQKQAIGFYAANFFQRIDMDVNLLYHPQVPIVKTLIHTLSNYDAHPSGQNVTLAVTSYDGYNMEDAIVVNKGSIERGLARSTYFRPAVCEEIRYSGGLLDEICVPDPEIKGYRTEKDYAHLESDGIVYLEAKVEEENVIIGRTSPPRFLNSSDEYDLNLDTRRESSIVLRHGESGIIDFVMISENSEGNKLIQTRIRKLKIPEIGDKFTSRHGQKGVIGLVVPEEDMPFSQTGIKPDIIFGSHGLPSRMTVSHVLELLGGKVGSLSARYIDSTAFSSEKEFDLRKELRDAGFRYDGSETMYDGRSGKVMGARIFVGNMYYLRLKHLVSNKMHARARGPIQLLTRQPTEGRAKEGGLRLGEMEKDTFVAHGASLLLKERFDSDKTQVPICEECGAVAIYDFRKESSRCPRCGDGIEVSWVEMSYAFSLFMNEIKSLGIDLRLDLRYRF